MNEKNPNGPLPPEEFQRQLSDFIRQHFQNARNAHAETSATGESSVEMAETAEDGFEFSHKPREVKAFLDRAPAEVTRATLAEGYVGLYLIELQIPAIVNAGPVELFISADGQESNRVQIYLET